ncbi:MAG: aminopeptidase P family protein [Clostridiales bacterium]|jgi:Xaa-Pro aminopeptidase|nr:aminopeptidase P family protein [Clostridiales bacterium]
MLDKTYGVDTMVLLDASNRYFYSNIATSYGAVVLNDNQKYLITDVRYAEYAKQNSGEFKVVVLQQGQDLFKTLAEIAVSLDSKSVGYEYKTILKSSFDKLASTIKCKLVPISSALDQDMAIKREYMIANMQQAQNIAEKSLDKVRNIIKVGVTEHELATQLAYEMSSLGASGPSFDIIVAFGENSAYPHHSPTQRKLKKTDIILIDMGAKYNGFCSDMTRTFCIGDVEPELQKIHSLVLQSQEYALSKIKAGLRCNYVDSLSREYLKANGYADKFVHSLGHGIGVVVHEYPRISSLSEDVLQSDMVITVEPGVYINGLGGVRIEDMILVQKDGIYNFANYNKSLYLS